MHKDNVKRRIEINNKRKQDDQSDDDEDDIFIFSKIYSNQYRTKPKERLHKRNSKYISITKKEETHNILKELNNLGPSINLSTE